VPIPEEIYIFIPWEGEGEAKVFDVEFGFCTFLVVSIPF
jgi:hypothetical protein